MAQPFNQDYDITGNVEATLWMGTSESVVRWVGAIVDYADGSGLSVLVMMDPSGTNAQCMPRVAAAHRMQQLALANGKFGHIYVNPDPKVVDQVIPLLRSVAYAAYSSGAASSTLTALAPAPASPANPLVGKIEYAHLLSKDDTAEWTGIISNYDGSYVLAWADNKRVVARRLPAGLNAPASYLYLKTLQIVVNKQIKGNAHPLALTDYRAKTLQHWVDTVYGALAPAFPSMTPEPAKMKLLWETATDMSQWTTPEALNKGALQTGDIGGLSLDEAFSLVSTATSPWTTAYAPVYTTTGNPQAYTVGNLTYEVTWDNTSTAPEPAPANLPTVNQVKPTQPLVEGLPPSADLACSQARCGHRLSSHLPCKANGEPNTCIADGCTCEAWRRRCAECLIISLAWATHHKPSCKTGELEREASARTRSLSRNRPRRQTIDVPDDF